MDRRDDEADQAHVVEEGQPAHAAVLLVALQALAHDGVGVVREVAVRDDDALGHAGRARGELDEAGVVRREAGVAEEGRVALEVGVGEHLAQAGRVVVQGAEDRLDLPVGDHEAGAAGADDVLAVVEVAAELPDAHRRVERDRDAAALGDAEEGGDELARLRQHDGDVVALLHAALLQRDGDLHGAHVERRPAQLFFREVVADEGEAVAGAVGGSLEGLRKGDEMVHRHCSKGSGPIPVGPAVRRRRTITSEPPFRTRQRRVVEGGGAAGSQRGPTRPKRIGVTT